MAEGAVSTIEQLLQVSFSYRVEFTRGAFEPANGCLVGLMGAVRRPRSVLAVVDAGLAAAQPDLVFRIEAYFGAHEQAMRLVEAPIVVPGGEAAKNGAAVVKRVLDAIERAGMCRHSFVLAVGGGAFLDAVGFAAATAHRGLRLVRMPSTVLGQNDAGIGVKNAINYRGHKNFLGCFAPPFAVVNDAVLLRTLSARDARAGLAEALKVALIRDADFFAWIERGAERLAALDEAALARAIRRCAELHLAHIRGSGDPFETGSARPLDFGHWLAHHLEERSGYALRHGEAVAVGIAVDSCFSQRARGLSEHELHRILTSIERLGLAVAVPALADVQVEAALEAFRAHLGGELCITLLDAIGRGSECHEVAPTEMRKSIDFVLRWSARSQ